MIEEIQAITETTKAVQETAKTGRAVIEAGSDVARFVSKVLGTVPQDVVGLTFGDYIGELRIRNLDKLQRKTEKILHDRGVEDPIPISPKLAIPFFEAVSEESDETLQGMWANLLANAMDPNQQDISLHRVFINTLKQFEPIDALILNNCAGYGLRNKFTSNALTKPLNLRRETAHISLERLAELKCLLVFHQSGYAHLDANFQVSALGAELHRACQPDPADQT